MGSAVLCQFTTIMRFLNYHEHLQYAEIDVIHIYYERSSRSTEQPEFVAKAYNSPFAIFVPYFKLYNTLFIQRI